MYVEFLETFDVGGEIEGKVTRAEFENYYANVGECIESDEDFETLLKGVWNLDKEMNDNQDSRRVSNEFRDIGSKSTSPNKGFSTKLNESKLTKKGKCDLTENSKIIYSYIYYYFLLFKLGPTIESNNTSSRSIGNITDKKNAFSSSIVLGDDGELKKRNYNVNPFIYNLINKIVVFEYY
jgi:hypothetical protein